MPEELKPCPFCGGEAKFGANKSCCGRTVRIDCTNPECGGCITTFSSKAEATKAWNRRAQQPNEPLTLDELRKMDRKSVYCVGYNEIVLVYIDEHSDLWITFANGDRLTARSCIDSAACKFFARPPKAGEKG